MDIRTVDLNLLPVLDALLRHCSVTHAARELAMSQSAVSSALARLRSLLDDELFVRTGRGLLPTPRAASLSEPVATLLAEVRDRILLARKFDPATADRTFSVSHSDVGSYVLWPGIVQAVAARAPGVRLRLAVLPQSAMATSLEAGQVDLAIGVYPGLPRSLFQRRLFERKYVGIVRASHPLAGKKLTLRAFVGAPQIVVRAASGIQDVIDGELRRRNLQRQTLEMPSYLMLPPLLEAGDYLAVLPGQLAEAFARHGHFGILKLPLDLPPTVVKLHWHRRFHGDPGNVWLRELIARRFAQEA